MSESSQREERRNLKKVLGETAAQAVEACRADVSKLSMQMSVVAKVMAELEERDKARAAVVAAYKTRLDGQGQWCGRNENATRELRHYVELGEDALWSMIDARLPRQLTFLERLRWLLFGDAPTRGRSTADRSLHTAEAEGSSPSPATITENTKTANMVKASPFYPKPETVTHPDKNLR